MKKIISQSRFSGGISGDAKEGIKNSFAYSQAIDFRKKPSQFSVLPGTAKTSSGVVTGLVEAMVQVSNGKRYALDASGNFYLISTAGVWSNIANVGTGGAGLIYRQDVDRIIMTGTNNASSYYPVSNSPSIEPDKYGRSRSEDPEALREGGTLTYAPITSISESGTDKCSITPDIEPMYSIKIYVTAKGTGDWTVTVHDDANNNLGSSTITNANLTNTALNEFVFTTPIRMLVKPNARTLHFHVTSTVADGTMQVTTANDGSTADFEMWADRFVTPNNGLHPAEIFQQFCVFGNERYLSVWEPLSDDPTNLEWNRHRLTFPPGYEVCGLATTDEFLAIACERRSTDDSREFQDGKIFFWDGGATTYNYFIDVPEGAPYGICSYKNLVYYMAGGALWAIAGRKETVKIRTFANTDSEFSGSADYTFVNPNMMTTRRGILLMGYPTKTSNQSLEHGVYSWGAIEKNYSNSFGYSYVISTGEKLNDGSNNLRIGMVKNFGDTLYISWRDGSDYGVDIVDNSSEPATTGTWESLIFDNGLPYKEKLALSVKVNFKTLGSDITITPKYKIDRESSWQTGDAISSGDSAKLSINKRFKEIQFGIDATCAGSDTPEVISVGLEFDDLSEEIAV